ncbi:MAG: hypothetical protein H8D45_22695 [Bacteroidetes bacterium]|nr:hypothetical protein [Bacteroidota bacterium]
MYDLLINILTHPTIGIVTFLIGILLGNFFAIGRDRRKEINDAAVKFRSVIAEEISELQSGKQIDPWGDKNHLNFLYAGMLEFKCVLPPIKQKALDDLWQKYEKHKIFNAIEELNDILSFTGNLHK